MQRETRLGGLPPPAQPLRDGVDPSYNTEPRTRVGNRGLRRAPSRPFPRRSWWFPRPSTAGPLLTTQWSRSLFMGEEMGRDESRSPSSNGTSDRPKASRRRCAQGGARSFYQVPNALHRPPDHAREHSGPQRALSTFEPRRNRLVRIRRTRGMGAAWLAPQPATLLARRQSRSWPRLKGIGTPMQGERVGLGRHRLVRVAWSLRRRVRGSPWRFNLKPRRTPGAPLRGLRDRRPSPRGTHSATPASRRSRTA